MRCTHGSTLSRLGLATSPIPTSASPPACRPWQVGATKPSTRGCFVRDYPFGGIESRHPAGACFNPAGPKNNMTSRQQLIPVAVAALFVASCGKQPGIPAMPPPEVGVIVVHARPVPVTREASARMAPTRASDVRARVPGVLQKRLYKEGSMVKEG